jgi:hypothetical protein
LQGAERLQTRGNFAELLLGLNEPQFRGPREARRGVVEALLQVVNPLERPAERGARRELVEPLPREPQPGRGGRRPPRAPAPPRAG